MDISTIFPVGNRGSILVTTRNPHCTIHASAGSHDLGKMGLEEAVNLFLRAANMEDDSSIPIQEDARTIVNTLGCLALAIVHAGAYVQQGLCSIGEYCTIYAHQREQLLNHLSVQARSSYGFSVYTTWEVSLDAVENRSDETSKHAIELIQILGFFHHDNIPEEVFERAWNNTRNINPLPKNLASLFYIPEKDGSEWNPAAIREAAVLLASFSLIKLDLIHRSMSMHPLVHAWARDRLSEDSRQDYRVAVSYSLSSAISWTFQVSDYRFRRMLLPHIDACLESSSPVLRYSDEDQIQMAAKFSLVFAENGRLRDSVELREKILAARQTTLSSDHSATLSAMQDLAHSYRDLGRRQESMELSEKVFEAGQRALGGEHPVTLRAMHVLACSYRDLGRYEEAMGLRKKMLEVRERILGSEHSDTLDAINNLAVISNDLGRHQEAMELKKNALETRHRSMGSEHPGTLRALNDLACSYFYLGRYQETMGLFKKTFEERQRSLGSEHPDTLISMFNLAISYYELGRYQEAIELGKKAFEGLQRVLGSEHPYTLDSIKLLKNCNEALNKNEALKKDEALNKV